MSYDKKCHKVHVLWTLCVNGLTCSLSFTGYYAYLEADYIQSGQMIRLISPTVYVANNSLSCFQFYYHMYGANMGYLNVYVEHKTANTTSKIFSQGGSDMGNMWYTAQISLIQEEGDFVVNYGYMYVNFGIHVPYGKGTSIRQAPVFRNLRALRKSPCQIII